jgi:hypothetical protein
MTGILAEVDKQDRPLRSCGCDDQHSLACPRIVEEVGGSIIEWRHHRLWPLWAQFVDGRFVRLQTYDGVTL